MSMSSIRIIVPHEAAISRSTWGVTWGVHVGLHEGQLERTVLL